jgi:hypothetical protein
MDPLCLRIQLLLKAVACLFVRASEAHLNDCRKVGIGEPNVLAQLPVWNRLLPRAFINPSLSQVEYGGRLGDCVQPSIRLVCHFMAFFPNRAAFIVVHAWAPISGPFAQAWSCGARINEGAFSIGPNLRQRGL